MKIHWLSPGLPAHDEWWPRWRTCLFLADYLHAELIQMGSPLFTSSFEVILHCEPIFHGCSCSGHSLIGQKQLCTQCSMYIVKCPIISVFSPLSLLIYILLWGMFFSSAFLSISELLFSCLFQALCLSVILSVANSVLLSNLEWTSQNPVLLYLSKR